MITVSADSLSTKRDFDDVTFNLANEIGEEKWLSVAGIDERLTKLNFANSNQTQVDHFNGESYAFDINLGQLLIMPPLLRHAREYFHVVQKWEGYVLQVSQDAFLVRLVPIVGEGTDLEAEIYLEDVEIPDQALVEPGAVFYWSIGYLIKPSGNKCRASLIRFRRLPPWTKNKLEAASIKAENLMSLLDEG